ncbi:hypothetical protein PR202_gb26437 [Eleusine coracana subsp. coracana]|uniref:Uncharacterized protein n=1 Tax=Eleusine coracana subsp. coracana TaxID=191504 RepID=A0AAV5FRU2_ELECO|nr:hypothetical protein PR202_gb26437 [Eleusine coracana subsp. coracana]
MRSRSSADRLEALSLQIERKLQKALSSSLQRPQILQQLFADIALKVDDRARDAILSENDDGIAPLGEREGGWICFYEILANHFVRVPESGRRILELIVQLWSQSFAANIFSLLFHKWLFEAPFDGKEISLRYSSALVQGATNYLLEDVALVPDRLSKISSQAGRDLFLLLSRFMFFYDQDHLLSSFLEHFPTFPNSFLVGGPSDYFVIELTDQLQKLKIEPVLLHYLTRMTILQGWSVPKACDKPVLPASISLVLAFLLLELCHDLCHDCLLLHPESTCLKLGESETAQSAEDPVP